MKFYKIIVCVILAILYSATIFGLEEFTISGLTVDTAGLVDQFGRDKQLYKKIGHVGSNPPFLNTILNWVHKPYADWNLVMPPDGSPTYWEEPSALLTPLKYVGYYVFPGLPLWLWFILEEKNLINRYSKIWNITPKTKSRIITALLLSPILFLPIIDRVINRFFHRYTYIGSFPKIISIDDVHDHFTVQDNEQTPAKHFRMPADIEPIHYTERRSLSNMKLRWRRFYTGNFLNPASLSERRNDLLYVLKNGKVNIYKSDEFQENNLPSEKDLPIDSVSMEKGITAFDVSNDGAIMITGGKDGISKWARIEKK